MSDLISRDDVIKQIEYHQNHKIINRIKTKYALEMVKSSIEMLPTAEPKVGKWIRIGYDIYECSECHQYVKTIDIDAYDWCHHCGAKMIGE